LCARRHSSYRCTPLADQACGRSGNAAGAVARYEVALASGQVAQPSRSGPRIFRRGAAVAIIVHCAGCIAGANLAAEQLNERLLTHYTEINDERVESLGTTGTA